jgi:hypothetical protein
MCRIWDDSDDVKTDVLSKKAASRFIEHLQELEKRRETEPENAQNPSSSSSENITDFPPTDNSFSPTQTEQIEKWREEMRLALGSVGINPLEWLAGFDSRCRSYEEKLGAYKKAMARVLLKKREQISDGLANQNWSEAEIDGEFVKFGIHSGLNNATDEQIGKMWQNYKQTRII